MNGEGTLQSKSAPLFPADIVSMVGLGTYWAWGICIAIGEHPLGMASYPFSEDSLPINVAFKLLFALIVLSFAPKADGFLRSSRCFWATFAAALTGSLLVIAPVPTIVQLCGNALTALANILLLQRWLIIIWSAAQRPYATMLAAAPFCFTFVLIVQSLPEGLSDTFACILPVLSLSLQLSAGSFNGGHFSTAIIFPNSLEQGFCHHDKPNAIQTVAFGALAISGSFPLSYYKYALDLGTHTIWGFVIGCSLLLTIALTVISTILERLCKVSHSQSYPIPLFVLFLGIMFISTITGPAGSVIAGAFVYAGDYLCRAYLYAFAFSHCKGTPDVTRRTSLVTTCILTGHIIGLFMGNAAESHHQTSIMAGLICAALFGVTIAVLPIISRLPDVTSKTPDPVTAIEEAYRRLAMQAQMDYGLTKRESDVYALLLQGMNAAMIATHLGLSQSTVKSHLDRIYKKAEVHTKEELVERIYKQDATDNRVF